MALETFPLKSVLSIAALGTVISVPIVTTNLSSVPEEEKAYNEPQMELEEEWTSTPDLEACASLGEEKNKHSKARYYLCLGEVKDRQNQQVRKTHLFYNNLEEEKVEGFKILKIKSFSWVDKSPQKMKLGLTNISHASFSYEVEWPSFFTPLQREETSPETLIPEVGCSLTQKNEMPGSYVFSCEGAHWSVVEKYKDLKIPKTF